MPRKNTRPKPPRRRAAWHIYNRGVAGIAIFRDDADRDHFLQLLGRYLRDPFAGEIELHAACLMTTHFHLVIVATDNARLSRFMQRLVAAYSIHYRRRHGGSGPLFDGPYRRKEIADPKQHRWTIAYVHDNHPSGVDYRYSTHRFYRTGDAPGWLEVEAGLRVFGGRRRYLAYMDRKAARRELDRGFFASGRRGDS
ncbi:MAG: transposase [Solirubrobacterales bacterium]